MKVRCFCFFALFYCVCGVLLCRLITPKAVRRHTVWLCAKWITNRLATERRGHWAILNNTPGYFFLFAQYSTFPYTHTHTLVVPHVLLEVRGKKLPFPRGGFALFLNCGKNACDLRADGRSNSRISQQHSHTVTHSGVRYGGPWDTTGKNNNSRPSYVYDENK